MWNALNYHYNSIIFMHFTPIFCDVKPNNPEILKTNLRISCNVKTIDLFSTSKCGLNELQLKFDNDYYWLFH
jgi:hypothetical protein